MNALLTVHASASIGAEQCFRERDLIRNLASRLYDYVGDSEDELLQQAESMAGEWERLGTLCKRNERDEQVTV